MTTRGTINPRITPPNPRKTAHLATISRISDTPPSFGIEHLFPLCRRRTKFESPCRAAARRVVYEKACRQRHHRIQHPLPHPRYISLYPTPKMLPSTPSSCPPAFRPSKPSLQSNTKYSPPVQYQEQWLAPDPLLFSPHLATWLVKRRARIQA